jgi:hypothetical protein
MHVREFNPLGLRSKKEVIAEMRAVLAPLLDEPFYIDPFHQPVRMVCVVCRTVQGHSVEHAPDCPVLRRDALLGR